MSESESNSGLPSSAALRAFAVAARRLSFTDAATELNLTQGAISHQIRELESRLQTKLFERLPRGIQLTATGKQYLPYVQDALDNLNAGEVALRLATNSNILTISCSPNFAQKWLVPRIGEFSAKHPNIDLRISAAPQHVNFATDDIDIAVRHGDGQWKDLNVTQLCEEWVFPVCSPHLLPDDASLGLSVEKLSGYTLIHDQQRGGWQEWLSAINVDTSEFNLDHGPIVSQTSLAIDAAVATQGIALARSALVELDLAAGRLVQPVEERVLADFSYWIVCRNDRASLPHIALFKEWLLDQSTNSL